MTEKKSNFYDRYDWQYMLSAHPAKGDEREKQDEIKSRYFKILSPEFPEWIQPYLKLPLMQRLKGVGLLCGTDWTRLYRNRFYYSRYDHSLGVALIVWHFTHDKAQALAGLLHDISTPVFSHVADFRKGDALKQEATEEDNAAIVKRDVALAALLAEDGLTAEQVADYHQYPVADNEIPQLSADRLEYMFPSGLALDGSWTFEEIERVYNDLAVLENEDGQPELGFRTIAAAEEYTLHFCLIGHILQLNENKLCLQLLAEVVKEAIALGLLTEEDTMRLSEAEVMARFDDAATRFETGRFQADESDNEALSADKAHAARFTQLYRTYRTMERIEHVDSPLPDAFNISMKVKQRYINPLVQPEGAAKAVRIASVSDKAALYVNDFLTYEDTLFGAVPFASESGMHNKTDDACKAGGRLPGAASVRRLGQR